MPAGNTLAAASPLNFRVSALQVVGDSVSANAPDFYTFRLNGRSSLNFTLNSLTPGGNVDFKLLASNGTVLQDSTNSGNLADFINRFDQAVGVYYLQVYTDSPTNASYSLNLINRNTALTDIIWRNYGTPGLSGSTALWRMSGLTPVSTVNFPISPLPDWQIAGTGDFNQDGQADIVWRNYGATVPPGGRTVIWTMNGETPTGTVPLNTPPVDDPNWRIEGVADFNNDGQGDLVWRYYGTTGPTVGQTVIWTMNGTVPTSTLNMPVLVTDPNWHIVGIGDFTGDGKPDLLWRNYGAIVPPGGRTVIWTMNGTTPTSTVTFPVAVDDINWHVDAIGDFNGDNQTDILWRNYGATVPPIGRTVIWTMNGTVPTSTVTFPVAVDDTNWQVDALRTRYEAPPWLDIDGNSFTTAFKIGNLNGSGHYSDQVGSKDSNDFYQFDIASDRTVHWVLESASNNVTMQLYQDANANGTIEDTEAISLTFQRGSTFQSVNAFLQAGTYYLRIQSASTQLQSTNTQQSPSTGRIRYTLTIDGNANYTAQVLTPALPDTLKEASGLVRGTGGFWWTILDSGNPNKLYALNEQGQVLAQVTVNGATNVDWEEITAGPNPNGSGRVLFIGDFGNNSSSTTLSTFPTVGSRTNQVIYMVGEPSLTDTSVNLLQTLPIQFPSVNGSPANYDIEAMIYDSVAQQLVLITKDLNGVATGLGGVSHIFTRSLDPTQPLLTEVATFDLTNRPLTPTPGVPYGLDRLVTGAALSDDGSVFLLRTYESVFRWVRSPNESWTQLFQQTPQVIDLIAEPQGEGIAFGSNNNDFFTISESTDPFLGIPAATGQLLRYVAS
ncbi:MAG: VCBS repeat-containing protein [Scytolyngbya sp. HA4215-MV1]|nr:VCBS repeat-containing protein [Scytolyngbya sp. HA4215-MV1]